MKRTFISLLLAALVLPASAEPRGGAPDFPTAVKAEAAAPSSVSGKTLHFSYQRPRGAIRWRDLLPSGTPAPWGEWLWLGGLGILPAYSYTLASGNTCTVSDPPARLTATYFKTAKGEATLQVAKQSPDGGGQAEYRLVFLTPTSGIATCRIREMSRETEMVNVNFTLE